MQLQFGRGNGGERPDVDTEVEDHVDPLHRDRGIDNDPLTGREDSDRLSSAAILLSDQRADVGLDSSRTKADDKHGSEQAWQSYAMFDANWQSGDEQDE